MRIAIVTVLATLVATASAQVSRLSQPQSPISKPRANSSSSQQPDSSSSQQPGSTPDSTSLPEPDTQPVAPRKRPVNVGLESRIRPDLKATDRERAAVTFTAYDLDVRLVPAQQAIAVRALLRVRNDSAQPIAHLPLQISSSLDWESVRIKSMDGDGSEKPATEAPLGLQTIPSDADHTGQLREVVVALPQPLAPGKVLTLEVIYSGTIELSGKRLEAIGTPSETARHSDWDRISPEFTGLRGFGNVAWYPLSSAPVLLGDGAKLFTETGRQKQRQSSATVQMKVSIEYLGAAPNLAVLDGHPVPITAGAAADTDAPADIPKIATCSLPPTTLGFAAPSLIIANRIEQNDLRSITGSTGPAINAYLRTGDELNIDPYLNAMAKVTPLLEQWLGALQKSPLTIVDLPEPDDAPFESGSVLLTPLLAATPNQPAEQLTVVTAHALAHSYFHSPREWLNEGVPYFVGTLWLERSTSRETALEFLDSAPLPLAEPASPANGDGQDLLHATDPVYYRSKAASVLWMLRDLVGDKRLSAALRDYDPIADTSPEYFERLLERAPRDVSPKTDSQEKDLKWLFEDWVYYDRGLPDLSIEGVYPSKSAAAGSWVVAVALANDGYAAADVPLTVRSHTNSSTERVRIAARSKITHRMLVQGWPVEVTLNDGTVPEVQISHHTKAVEQAPEQH